MTVSETLKINTDWASTRGRKEPLRRRVEPHGVGVRLVRGRRGVVDDQAGARPLDDPRGVRRGIGQARVLDHDEIVSVPGWPRKAGRCLCPGQCSWGRAVRTRACRTKALDKIGRRNGIIHQAIESAGSGILEREDHVALLIAGSRVPVIVFVPIRHIQAMAVLVDGKRHRCAKPLALDLPESAGYCRPAPAARRSGCRPFASRRRPECCRRAARPKTCGSSLSCWPRTGSPGR